MGKVQPMNKKRLNNGQWLQLPNPNTKSSTTNIPQNNSNVKSVTDINKFMVTE